ncbi:MAG: hypothetical protein EXS31_01075 [Pedosphaera sp.]|nr:hypothetical protein [Pedosphaera sp.]
MLSSLGLALSGCVSSRPAKSAWTPTGDAVTDGKTAIAGGPARDKVWWQYRTALAAMRRGETTEAKSLLDDALLTVGSISSGDKEARKSRGYFQEESRKAFRGEPYERAMANYYRGILYWMDGEPDNARACFRNAQFQDGDVENKQYAGDFVLLDYLDGLVTTKLAGDGSDALKRAQSTFKGGALQPYDSKANVLFFVEFGKGPTKYATGGDGEELRFRTVPSAVHSARLMVGEQIILLAPYDDLNFQATTRGGRVMDHVLANKAVFKSATDAVGTAALVSGIVVAQNRNTREVGLGLVAAGLLGKIISSATTPAADTRCWETLPQYLSFAAAVLPAGQHLATVEFLDSMGMIIPRLTKTVTLNVAPEPRDTVVFVSDHSQTSKPL